MRQVDQFRHRWRIQACYQRLYASPESLPTRLVSILAGPRPPLGRQPPLALLGTAVWPPPRWRLHGLCANLAYRGAATLARGPDAARRPHSPQIRHRDAQVRSCWSVPRTPDMARALRAPREAGEARPARRAGGVLALKASFGTLNAPKASFRAPPTPERRGRHGAVPRTALSEPLCRERAFHSTSHAGNARLTAPAREPGATRPPRETGANAHHTHGLPAIPSLPSRRRCPIPETCLSGEDIFPTRRRFIESESTSGRAVTDSTKDRPAASGPRNPAYGQPPTKPPR